MSDITQWMRVEVYADIQYRLFLWTKTGQKECNMCDYVSAVFAAKKENPTVKNIAMNYEKLVKKSGQKEVQLSKIRAELDILSEYMSDGRNRVTTIDYKGGYMYIFTECANTYDTWLYQYLAANQVELSLKQVPYQSYGDFICYDNNKAFEGCFVFVEIVLDAYEVLSDSCFADSFDSEEESVNALTEWLKPLVNSGVLPEFKTLKEFKDIFEEYFECDDNCCFVNYFTNEGID